MKYFISHYILPNTRPTDICCRHIHAQLQTPNLLTLNGSPIIQSRGILPIQLGVHVQPLLQLGIADIPEL